MASNYAELHLKMLYFIETRGNLMAPLKFEVQALRLKLNFLRPILRETGKSHVEDGNLKALLTRVQSLCNHEYMDLGRLRLDLSHVAGIGYSWRLPMTMDDLLSSMLERIEFLRPDIQEIYTKLSKSSRSVAEMTNESVMEHLNSCLENIVDLLSCKADSVVPVEEELKAVQKGLRFLRNFLGFAESRCCKLGKLKDLLIHAEIVADSIECLLYLCCGNYKMDDQMISRMKVELLSQIQRIRPSQPEVRKIYVNILKASNSVARPTKAPEFMLGFLDSLRENLSELSKNNLGFSISVKDQMLTLHEELRFLECLVVDSPIEEHADHAQKLRDLCEVNNDLIHESACVIYSFYDSENDDMASKWNFLVSKLLAKLKFAKEKARQIYDKLVPKYLRCNFPSTNAQGFTNSLLGNLKQLVSSNAESIAPLKHHIEPVLGELLSLREYFSKTQEQSSEQEELEDQWTHFKDVAYQTEWVIDSFLAKDGEIWFHKLGLLDVIEEIKTIKTWLNHVGSKMADESTVLQKISSFPSQISLPSPPKDELVVFELLSQKIKEQLTNGSKKLQILAIVGMPGIGKTTLANSVFQHSSVTYHFHVRASCCVSQAYDRRRLLVKILKEVTGQTLDCSVEDLEHKLCQSLKGTRYLIFLDDIWDLVLLGNMIYCLPDDGKGSRIMVKSRLYNIAAQAGGGGFTYRLSQLSDDKSWEMLQFKLFGKENCPRELVEVGKKIAISCKGLPLTIDLVAGILREMERKQDFWKELAESNLLTKIFDDAQGRCRQVVEHSYHHLPYFLRPCFLYIGSFPEDIRIKAKRLGLMWIAEGFVELPENDERSLEDVARAYLDQLISRSLIMVSRRGSLSRVKAIHIHDVLRDFAIDKAKEERFLLPIDGRSNFSTLSSDGYPWCEQYRFCISAEYREQFTSSNPSGPRVRSLLFSGKEHGRPIPDDISADCPINFSNFRLLRVLDVPNVHIKHISPPIFQLIHLRFLALRSCPSVILSAVLEHLQNLEILLIKYILQSSELSTRDIANMARLRFLRHFRVGEFTLPCVSQEILEKPFLFDNLRSLSSLLLRLGGDFHENFMRQMPNIQKLRCIIGISRNPNPPPKLNFLENLESLVISHRAKEKILSHRTILPSFPPHLKKLKLQLVYLSYTSISAIGKLENLEALKLRFLRSSTDRWDMVEFGKQFPKLKYLELGLLNIREWNASAHDLPFLERLNVAGCEYLEELPSCLAQIPTLQEMILRRCRNSLAISAKKIKEEQEEMGNEQLVLKIQDIIDEGPSRIKKTFYEEGLAFLNGRAQDLSNDAIMVYGIWANVKRQEEMNQRIKQYRSKQREKQKDCLQF